MSYYKVKITDKNDYYNNLGLNSPCYVKSGSEDEALEKFYRYAKKSEKSNDLQ